MFKLVLVDNDLNTTITNHMVKPLMEVILSLKKHEVWILYKNDKVLLTSSEMGPEWLRQKRV